MKRAIGLTAFSLFVLFAGVLAPAQAAPEGQLTLGLHISLAPVWFDPADTSGIVTPFWIMYGLHDALVKPMPGKAMGPSLAESWTVSADGLTYEFVLRKGVRFHNGDVLTADDVKFSFERYRGASVKTLRDKVRQVQIVDPQRVRFQLREPWPDFLVFYATPATGAAWIVPAKYVQKVGDEGFKKAPIGAGPYRFVSFNPGVELVLEAHEQYWRKTPSVKRLVLKTVVDETTRLAMLKRGEIDIAYAFRGVTAEEIRRTQGLTLKPSDTTGLHWFLFSEQWDPKSLWADRRVRLAVNHAIDRDAINKSLLLGFARMTGGIIPHGFEYALPIPPYAYDPVKAKQLLAEAGHPNGFDGEIAADANFTEIAESAANYLVAVGIRTKVRSYERAAHLNGLREKKYRGIVYLSSGAYGSTATRLDAFVAAGGLFTYGTYPDIEGLIREQSVERDPKRREATLHRIQQLMHERVMFAPIWGLAVLNAHGSRVADPALGLVAGHQFSAPYEELRLKGR